MAAKKNLGVRLSLGDLETLAAYARTIGAPTVSDAARQLMRDGMVTAVAMGATLKALCTAAGAAESVANVIFQAARDGNADGAVAMVDVLTARAADRQKLSGASAWDVQLRERAAIAAATFLARLPDTGMSDLDRQQILVNTRDRDFERLACDFEHSIRVSEAESNAARGGGKVHDLREARDIREHEAAWAEPTPTQAARESGDADDLDTSA